jgi:DNA polymerase-4
MAADVNSILHIDMDAFFAAVEVLDHPELRGKPVIVGSPPDRRGVVATASYEARVFGVRSAMPSRTAGRLCPDGVFVAPRMDRYLEVSDRIMALLESFTPIFEPLSCDEAFLDLRGVLRRWASPRALAVALKRRIRDEIGLTASVGLARNKFLAKLASDLEKPDGLVEVPEDDAAVAAFLAPLPVRRIWGVGPVSEKAFLAAGLRTIGDIQQVPLPRLEAMVGPGLAAHALALAFGRDDRPVETEYEAKSISAENTYDEDCDDPEALRETLVGQAEHVGWRMRRAGRVGAVAHLKLRFADFRTITRQAALPVPTAADRELIAAALSLYDRQRVRQPVRLIGFGVSGLVGSGRGGADPLEVSGQLELFGDPAAVPRRRDEKLDRALDRLREQFGTSVVRRGVHVSIGSADRNATGTGRRARNSAAPIQPPPGNSGDDSARRR